MVFVDHVSMKAKELRELANTAEESIQKILENGTVSGTFAGILLEATYVLEAISRELEEE